MLSKIKKLFSQTPKNLAVLVAIVAIAVPAIVLAWGPERPTFDYNKYIENVSCTDPSQAFGRCGSMDGPVFNSFINTPGYGDERNFNRIAEVVPGQSPSAADYGETKTAKLGKEYWVRTLVHNNANQETNGPAFDYKGIAKNTRVKLQIAEGQANGVGIMTHITADNAAPADVWDSSTLVNEDQAFSVSYVAGSAVIYNSGQTASWPVSDDIASANGVLIGNNGNLNGQVSGCFDQQLYVYIKVTPKAPDLQLNKVTRVEGAKDWEDSISVKLSDTVDWKITFANRGTDVAHNVTIRDTLPTGVTLVPGSIRWVDANHPFPGEVLQDTALGSGGVNIGNYSPAGNDPNGNGYIWFKTTINDDLKECELKNVAFGHAENIPETSDDSKVIIEDCNPVVPVVSCNDLTVASLGSRKFRYTVDYTAQNATLKTVLYNFGDDKTLLVNSAAPVEHTYAKDGNYTTTTELTFDVNGKDQVIKSADCTVLVSAQTPKNNCPIPGKTHLPADSPECKNVPENCPIPGKTHLPKNSPECVLPNTGMESMFGLFTATTVAGAAAHKVFTGRRSDSL